MRYTTSTDGIGIETAISDGHLAAYIPLLEVLPAYRNRGVGSQLIKMMLDQLEGLYMIDLRCDEQLEPFYERLGFSGWAGSERTVGMGIRDCRRQSGRWKHDIGRGLRVRTNSGFGVYRHRTSKGAA